MEIVHNDHLDWLFHRSLKADCTDFTLVTFFCLNRNVFHVIGARKGTSLKPGLHIVGRMVSTCLRPYPKEHITALQASIVKIFCEGLLLSKTCVTMWKNCLIIAPIILTESLVQSALKHGRRTFLYSAMGELVCREQLWARAALRQLRSDKVG